MSSSARLEKKGIILSRKGSHSIRRTISSIYPASINTVQDHYRKQKWKYLAQSAACYGLAVDVTRLIMHQPGVFS